MLDDPIVRSVMRRDGVTRGEVEELVGNLLHRRTENQGGGRRASAAAEGNAPEVMQGEGRSPCLVKEAAALFLSLALYNLPWRGCYGRADRRIKT